MKPLTNYFAKTPKRKQGDGAPPSVDPLLLPPPMDQPVKKKKKPRADPVTFVTHTLRPVPPDRIVSNETSTPVTAPKPKQSKAIPSAKQAPTAKPSGDTAKKRVPASKPTKALSSARPRAKQTQAS